MKTLSDKPVLAIDAGGTTIKAALVFGGNTPVDFFQTPIPQTQNPKVLLDAFYTTAQKAVALAKARGTTLLGAGVCIPGPFDYEHGISLMNHKYQAIKGISLFPTFSRALAHLPVQFMHDSSAFLLGTLALRPMAHSNLCAVIIGTGLGFACLKGGRLFQNQSGGPGISIFKTPYQGQILEDFVSKRGITTTYQNLGGSPGASVKDMAALAAQGDKIALAAFNKTGEILADSLKFILQENNFTCMILGGQIAKAGSLLTAPIQSFLTARGIACNVETAFDIDNAPIVGAARLIYSA